MAVKTHLNNARKISLLMVILTFSAIAHAKIIYVDDDASPLGDGTSWETAFTYLQDALADANTSAKPVEIHVAQGTYTPDSNSANPNGSGDRYVAFQLINGVALKVVTQAKVQRIQTHGIWNYMKQF
jgi:hypothetical protein